MNADHKKDNKVQEGSSTTTINFIMSAASPDITFDVELRVFYKVGVQLA